MHVFMCVFGPQIIIIIQRFTPYIPYAGIPSTPPPSLPHPSLKLFYTVATATSHTPWSRDSAEPLPLSVEECLWMCVLLAQSTLALPPSQRVAGGLKVRTGRNSHSLNQCTFILRVMTFEPRSSLAIITCVCGGEPGDEGSLETNIVTICLGLTIISALLEMRS